MTRLLIINANFYTDLSEALHRGAVAAIEAAGAQWEEITVPGALEIPPVIAMAMETGRYDGYVALGCVIRGETGHYDIVANDSCRGLMELGIRHKLAIGNGILTVENDDQAWARADPARKNKGAGAAEAALRLIEVRRQLEGQKA